MIRALIILTTLMSFASLACGGEEDEAQPQAGPPVAMATSAPASQPAAAAEIVQAEPTATAKRSVLAQSLPTPTSVPPTPTATVAPPSPTPAAQASEDDGLSKDRIPPEVLREAFAETLHGEFPILPMVPKQPLGFQKLAELNEDTKYPWADLPWKEYTYVADFASDSYTLIVRILGEGLSEAERQVLEDRHLDWYYDDTLWSANRNELWSEDRETLRTVLSIVFDGNLADSDITSVDLHCRTHLGTWGDLGEKIPEDEIRAGYAVDRMAFEVFGDMEYNVSGQQEDTDLYAAFFMREGYIIWVSIIGPGGPYSLYSKEDLTGQVGYDLDQTLIRLLEEYP